MYDDRLIFFFFFFFRSFDLINTIFISNIEKGRWSLKKTEDFILFVNLCWVIVHDAINKILNLYLLGEFQMFWFLILLNIQNEVYF